MIKTVSRPIFAHPNDKVLVTVELLSKVDEIGNFSIETANPGGYWGTAIPQLPSNLVIPKIMQTQSFAGVVHKRQQKAKIEYACLYPTWLRVVQYLNADQVPSVKARVEIKDLGFKERVKRLFKREKINPPTERIF